MGSRDRNKSRNRHRNSAGRHPGHSQAHAPGQIRALKSLGQNFLIDENVIYEIIEGSGITGDSLVIEIGPGTGALTLPLAEKAGRLICIELDDRMIEGLKIKTFGMDNVRLMHGDILETDLASLIRDEKEKTGLEDVRIIGNLPYYITTPIITKLLEEHTGAASVTVMMQKEVADRIAAEPGTRDAGAITYSVHYRAMVTRIAEAGRECFRPVPNVDSSVLRLDILDEPSVDVRDEDLMMRCIRAGFLQRRKTLLNSLQSLGDYDKISIAGALKRAGIDSQRRAESLSLAEFASLADSLAAGR